MGWANFLGSLMDNNTDPNVAKAMQEGQILSLYCVFIPILDGFRKIFLNLSTRGSPDRISFMINVSRLGW